MVSKAIVSVHSCLVGGWTDAYDGNDDSSATLPVATNETPAKKVRFDQVRVHTHKIVLGDNPSCSQGPPIAISWDHAESDHFQLDEYESQFKHSLKRIGCEVREQWLRESGHTDESFSRIKKEVNEIKASRRQTKKELATSGNMALPSLAEYKRLLVSLSFRASEMEANAASKDSAPQLPRRNRTVTEKTSVSSDPPKMPLRRRSFSPSRDPGRRGVFSRLRRQSKSDTVPSMVSGNR